MLTTNAKPRNDLAGLQKLPLRVARSGHVAVTYAGACRRLQGLAVGRVINGLPPLLLDMYFAATERNALKTCFQVVAARSLQVHPSEGRAQQRITTAATEHQWLV